MPAFFIRNMQIHPLNNENDIVMKTIQPDDIQEFYAFSKYIFYELNEYTIDTPEEFSHDIDIEKQRIEKFNLPGNLLLGAFYDGQLIGVLDFNSNKRKRINHWGKFGISIHHDFQNRGIGTKMVRFLIEWAKQNEQTKMILLSVHANNERAIALYNKMGFVQCGYFKNCIREKDNSFTDSIDMVLYLDAL